MVTDRLGHASSEWKPRIVNIKYLGSLNWCATLWPPLIKTVEYQIVKTKFNNDVWLTVHRSSMWNKKPTRCHLVLYLFLLYKLLSMFRATLCPSSGADDLVVFFHVWCSAVAV